MVSEKKAEQQTDVLHDLKNAAQRAKSFVIVTNDFKNRAEGFALACDALHKDCEICKSEYGRKIRNLETEIAQLKGEK